MKKYLYLTIAAVLLGFTACSNDDDDSQSNYTDMAVTGSVGEFSLDDFGYISTEINGYLNLTDELRLAVGMSPVFGVELSTNSSFPEDGLIKFPSQRLEDNRKFKITATFLQENTTYFYRTYLTETIFGHTKQFTTGSYEAAAAKMTTSTGDIMNVSDHTAVVQFEYENLKNTGVAYSTESSVLTVEKVKAALNSQANNGVNISNDRNLSDLTSGTKYYYCEFREINNLLANKKFIILGEVKSFTTTGYNAEELAKQVTVNARLDESTQMWTVNIQSSLASSMTGKTVRFGVTHHMTTSYPGGADKYEVGCMYKYYGDDWETNNEVYKLYTTSGSRVVDFYGAVVFGQTVYASGSGNSYNASIENPFYNSTRRYSEYEGWEDIENWWDESVDNILPWFEFSLFMELCSKIKNGIATDKDLEIYEALYYECENKLGFLNYSCYVTNYLQVFVEIDGIRYVVKEQEGMLRLPTMEDNPLFDPKNGSKIDHDNDNDEPTFDPDAEA